MKKRLLLPFLLLALSGCNTNEQLRPENNNTTLPNSEATIFTYKIDKNRALTIAQDAALKFSDSELTKTGRRRILELIPIISGSNTATKGGSEQIDTLMFVLNYADSMGYVFISTDERTGDVIAFIEKGNFNIQDTSKSELTNFLVSLMLNYQRTSLAELRERDSNHQMETKGPSGSNKTYAAYLRNGQGPICNQVLRTDCNYGKPVTAPYEAQVQGDYYYKNKGCIATREFREPDMNIGPLLTTQWNQTAPFHNDAPLIGGERAYAGCTAIATAQLMVYHSYPTNYPSDIHNGMSTYIASLRKEKIAADFTSFASKDCVAQFVRTIGDLLGNSWGVYPDGTGGSQYKVPNCFAKMGYKTISSVMAYNHNTILRSIDIGRPVITIGWTNTVSPKEGHTWIIDGYKKMNTGYDNYYFDEYGHFNGSKFGAYRDNNTIYFSCNYGWGGSYDGYYLNGLFNTGNGNLSSLLEIIPYIRK